MSCGNPHATPCEVVIGLMMAFLEQQLDPEMRHQVEHHLDECPPCVTVSETKVITLDAWVEDELLGCAGYEPAPEEVRIRMTQRFSVTVRFQSEQ